MFDFPETYLAADRASLDGQCRFMRSTRIQLLLLVVASAAGSFSWAVNDGWDAAGLLAGVAFAAAAVLRVMMLRSRPHRVWYDGRAAAESVKTIGWKYAVGGDPFVLNDAVSDDRFAALVRDVVESFDTLGTARLASAAPTDSMRRTRAADLADRKALYASDRIHDQQEWYRRKADWNNRRARLWGSVVLVLQVGAAVGAFLKGFGVVDIDIFGLAGAAVASAAAWLETKQHHSLARAYRVAAEELAAISDLIEQQASERDWATFVAEAEEAISREHTMWKASSRTREPISLA
jgi:hypothetical protein